MATVAIDGSYNAGLLAVQILAVSDESLAEKILQYKQDMPKAIAEANKKAQELLIPLNPSC